MGWGGWISFSCPNIPCVQKRPHCCWKILGSARYDVFARFLGRSAPLPWKQPSEFASSLTGFWQLWARRWTFHKYPRHCCHTRLEPKWLLGCLRMLASALVPWCVSFVRLYPSMKWPPLCLWNDPLFHYIMYVEPLFPNHSSSIFESSMKWETRH